MPHDPLKNLATPSPALSSLARLGDAIEADVRHPVPGTIRMRLQTVESCAAGNALLMDPTSGWRLVHEPSDARCAEAHRTARVCGGSSL